MVVISGFTKTTDNPFVLFPSSSGGNDKTYFNGLTTSGSTGNYYYKQGNVFVFQRIGDLSGATGSITIDSSLNVTAYLVGGGGNGNSNTAGGGGSYTKVSFTSTSSPYTISIGSSATVTTFGSYTAAGGTNGSGSGVGKKFVDNSLGYTYFYGAGGGNNGHGGNGYNSLGGSGGGGGGGGGGGYNHGGGGGYVNGGNGCGGGGGFAANGQDNNGTNGGNGGGPNGGNGSSNVPSSDGGLGGGGGGGGRYYVAGGKGGLLGGGGGSGGGGPYGADGGAGGGGGGASYFSIGGVGGAGGGGGGGGQGIATGGGTGGIGGGGGGGGNGAGGVGLLVLVILLPPPPPCFLYNSKILTNQGYRPIQDLRKGDLVKTLKHYYKPIDMIGKRDMNHPASQERIKNQLYKCSKDEYPELKEDLIITGCHSILVDSFKTDEQIKKAIEVNEDRLCVTDDKFRLPACVDDRASVYETQGEYTVYHLALENEDYFSNYGIYANGLLVETCSKRYLKELSGMDLIE